MYSYFVLFLIVVFTIFEGAKSGVLYILSLVFMILYLNRESYRKAYLKMKKNQFKLFAIATISSIIVIVVQAGNNLGGALTALMFRLVSSGDTYYMAYPNNTIESLTQSNFLVVFFGDFFRTTRVLPEEFIHLGMGFELSAIANNAPGILAGPNPRHNLFGYVHFGFWGGILFSFFCGLILNITRSRFIYLASSSSFYEKMLVMLLYLVVFRIEADPPSAIANFNNLIIFLPVIIFLGYTIKYAQPRLLVNKAY